MDEPRLMCDPDALAEVVRSGDIQALDALTRCYGRRLLAVGRRRCADEESAKDAVQDALTAAGEHLDQFRGDGSVEGWLVRMVSNACARMRRGQKNDPRLHVPADKAPLGAAEDDPEDLMARGELMEVLGEALLSLEPRDRTLVLLADAEGWRAPEIAEATGMTPGSVRTRLSRARRRLREHLMPVAPDFLRSR